MKNVLVIYHMLMKKNEGERFSKTMIPNRKSRKENKNAKMTQPIT